MRRTPTGFREAVRELLAASHPRGNYTIGDVNKAEETVRQRFEAERQRALAEAKGKRLAMKKAARGRKPATSPSPSEPGAPPLDTLPDSEPGAPPQAAEASYEPPVFAPPATPEAELAARELCRRRLLPFVRRFRPRYLAGWVHADICRRIERFVAAVEAGQSPRLLLLMPPRTGKSELSSRHTPAWILGKHPEWEIIAASHTASLALSFSRYIRDLMRNPGYAAVFPAARLDPSSQSLENWNTTQAGGYLAAGCGSGITGRGAHVLILDDVIKDMEAASSDTIRENIWEWYASTAYTRLSPGGGVLGLMTWWHEDDWAGRIQEVSEKAAKSAEGGDVFEVVRYPAINEEGDEYILADDAIEQFAPQRTPPPGARLTRLKGTAIHPERYTTKMMRAIQYNLTASGQKRVWDALYQQNPLPDEGVFFEKKMLRFYAAPPAREALYIYQAWDFAISEGKESDYTVGVCLGQDSQDNLYLLDIRRFKSSDGGYLIDELLHFAREWGANYVGFEDGQIWRALDFQFQKRCDELRQWPSFELLKPLTDKMARAHPLRGRMQLGKLWFDAKAPYYTELQRELLTFPHGKHDDQVDALAWAVRLTLAKGAPRPRNIAPRAKSWRDRFLTPARRGESHMAA
ncbi:MAG: terminase family protein [Zoogloeaceae bacterium]|nr:terminase family protein [Zoogloeaceae bacterium]